MAAAPASLLVPGAWWLAPASGRAGLVIVVPMMSHAGAVAESRSRTKPGRSHGSGTTRRTARRVQAAANRQAAAAGLPIENLMRGNHGPNLA
jgi:hypothetical protein